MTKPVTNKVGSKQLELPYTGYSFKVLDEDILKRFIKCRLFAQKKEQSLVA